MRTVEIKVMTGVSAGDVFTFNLSKEDSIKIGRADSNELVLSDPRISRTHCGILAKEDSLYLYDLGSAAGTIHMGFQLKSGEAGARPLSTGDEFKIGDSLFRVSISSDNPTSDETVTDASATQTVSSSAGKLPPKKKRLLYLATGAAVVLLLVVFLMPEEKKNVLPRQLSNVSLDLPAYRMVGYWPGGRSTPATRKDSAHLDKAQFRIPATNQLIEYDYISEAPIVVSVDGVEVEELPAYSSGWRRKELLIRDVAQGVERKLIFDNQGYPAKGTKGKFKRWAVRNVRVTPIDRPLDSGVEQAARAAAALADDFDKSPDGLFELVRALQSVALELLIDQSADFISVSIQRDDSGDTFDELDAAEVTETLDAIISERLGEFDPSMDKRHLQAISSLISNFDGELWRRVDSRFRQVKHSAAAKNSIVVYDNLVAIKTMFPDESDYRWVRANRMLNDKKYVSKKVRRNPERYRR